MDFNSVLETKAGEVEKPPLLPKGPYTWSISSFKQEERGADNQYTVIDIECKCVEAQDTVDQMSLEEYGSVSGVTRRVSFLFNNGDDEESVTSNKKTLYRCTQFLGVHCQIPDWEDKSVKELLAEATGAQFIGVVDWRQDKNDKEMFYDEIRKTMPIL